MNASARLRVMCGLGHIQTVVEIEEEAGMGYARHVKSFAPRNGPVNFASLTQRAGFPALSATRIEITPNQITR